MKKMKNTIVTAAVFSAMVACAPPAPAEENVVSFDMNGGVCDESAIEIAEGTIWIPAEYGISPNEFYIQDEIRLNSNSVVYLTTGQNGTYYNIGIDTTGYIFDGTAALDNPRWDYVNQTNVPTPAPIRIKVFPCNYH